MPDREQPDGALEDGQEAGDLTGPAAGQQAEEWGRSVDGVAAAEAAPVTALGSALDHRVADMRRGEAHCLEVWGLVREQTEQVIDEAGDHAGATRPTRPPHGGHGVAARRGAA